MNFSVLYNSTDITSYVTRYEREHALCSGIGTAVVTVTKDMIDSYTVIPYGVIKIYESSHLVGTYYVDTITIEDNGTVVDLSCQDSTKKLNDYFIAEYYTVDYLSYTRYWITKFLEEAGVSFQFDTDEPGSPISNNSILGLTSAYDALMQMVQQSGWYFRADQSGVIHIGKIDVKFGNEDISLPGETTILDLRTIKDDSKLRNRVVVWGSGAEDEGWIFADVQEYTSYNYDHRDVRTAVLSNGNIYNNTDAMTLAKTILKETNQISYVKEIELAGFIYANVGQTSYLESRLYSGWGLITGLSVACNGMGATTIVTLDDRCPRLFGFFGYKENYAYIATEGAGVWRKPLTVNGWENYSTGLTNLNIRDLAVNRALMSCVTSDGALFARKPVTNWVQLVPDAFPTTVSGNLQPDEHQRLPIGQTEQTVGLSGLNYGSGDVVCLATDINRTTNEILGVFTIADMLVAPSGWFIPYSGEPVPLVLEVDGTIPDNGWLPYSGQYWHSWLVTSPNSYTFEVEEIFVNGSNDVYAYDVANNGEDTFIACMAKIPNDPFPKRYNRELTSDNTYNLHFKLDPVYEDTLMYVEPYTNSVVDFTELSTRIEPIRAILGGYSVTYANEVNPVSTAAFSFDLLGWKRQHVSIPKLPPYGPDDIVPPDITVGYAGTLPTEGYFSPGEDQLWYDAPVWISCGGFDLLGYDSSGNSYILGSLQASYHWKHWWNILEADYFYATYFQYILFINGQPYNVGGSRVTITSDYLAEPIEWDESPDLSLLTQRYIPGDVTAQRAVGEGDNMLCFSVPVVDAYEPVTLAVYNPKTVTYITSYTLRYPDETPYLPSQNVMTCWFLHDRDPYDSSVYMMVVYATGHPAQYGELIAFDGATGIIRRVYPSHIFNDYFNACPTYIYKNNIYSQFYADEYSGDFVIDPPVLNELYNKMISFDVVEPSYDLSRDKLVNGVAKKTDKGDFILLTTTPQTTHIEASTYAPLLAYGGIEGIGVGFLKIFQLGFNDDDLDEYTYLNAISPNDPVDNLIQVPLDPNISQIVESQVLTPSYVPDARVFDWLSATTDSRFVAFTRVTPSGTLNEHGWYDSLTISGENSIYMVDYFNANAYDLSVPVFTSWQKLLVNETAAITHMETTNYSDIPYILASTDDVPARFFEREKIDQGELQTTFQEYNLNLPSAKINCIRCDDRI